MLVPEVNGFGYIQDIALFIKKALKLLALDDPKIEWSVGDINQVVYGDKVKYTAFVKYGSPKIIVYQQEVYFDKDMEFGKAAFERLKAWQNIMNDMLCGGITQAYKISKELNNHV